MDPIPHSFSLALSLHVYLSSLRNFNLGRKLNVFLERVSRFSCSGESWFITTADFSI